MLSAGLGAGVAIVTPADSQTSVVNVCPSFGPPEYFPYHFDTTVTLSDVRVVDNAATGRSCSGGGVSIGPGGLVTLSRVVIANNSAALFGGGLLLGALQTSTCGFDVVDSGVSNNTAGHAGSQLYSSCSAHASVRGTTIAMAANDSQVPATHVTDAMSCQRSGAVPGAKCALVQCSALCLFACVCGHARVWSCTCVVMHVCGCVWMCVVWRVDLCGSAV